MPLVCRSLAVTPPGAARPVVEGISLAIRPGEWIAIAGANGGGKTSLALALAGLWPATAGELTLDGVPIAPGSEARTRIACVLQDPGSQLLQPTVADELAFALHNLGRDAATIQHAVRNAADTFGLTADLDRDPRTLSAGRQQLVLIAAAAALEPALLVADEPTAHLDPGTRSRVLAWLSRALDRGMSACWVTQDPDELARAHRVVRIGESPPLQNKPAVAPDPGAARITVTVAPVGAAAGPHVRRDTPLTFTIGERGVTALLGPNGAGKSVLLAALAGQADAPQITVEWKGAPADPPILTLQYPELQVFEERIGDEVVYAARMRGRSREEALRDAGAAFETVGLAPGFDGRTWELSTGVKRLVETIGALIAPAGVILLDEPTAGLDARRREGLARLIAERARSVPVVIASQDRRWLDELGVTRVEVAGHSAER